MEDIKLNLGNKIKILREIKGFTQEAIASEIGISQQAFRKIETGECKVDLLRAAKIAKSLNIELEGLINFQPANYLNNCNQSGVINTNNNLPDKFVEQLEKQIDLMNKELDFLREQNDNLMEILKRKS